jgi:hypothetical protein
MGDQRLRVVGPEQSLCPPKAEEATPAQDDVDAAAVRPDGRSPKEHRKFCT